MRRMTICLSTLLTVFGGVPASAESIEFPHAPVAAAFPEWGAPAAPSPSPTAEPVPAPARAEKTPPPARPAPARRAPRSSAAAVPEASPAGDATDVVLPDPPAPPLAWVDDEVPTADASAAAGAVVAAGPAVAARPPAGAEEGFEASAAVAPAPAAAAPPVRRAASREAARAGAARTSPRPSGVRWGWIAAASLTGGALLLLARAPSRRPSVRRRVGEPISAYAAETIGDLARAPAPPVRVRARPPDVVEPRASVPFHDAIERRLRHRASEAMGEIVHVARFRAERRADEIREMAETGEPAVRIARRIGVPLGEVEAVLGVERRREEVRAS